MGGGAADLLMLKGGVPFLGEGHPSPSIRGWLFALQLTLSFVGGDRVLTRPWGVSVYTNSPGELTAREKVSE